MSVWELSTFDHAWRESVVEWSPSLCSVRHTARETRHTEWQQRPYNRVFSFRGIPLTVNWLPNFPLPFLPVDGCPIFRCPFFLSGSPNSVALFISCPFFRGPNLHCSFFRCPFCHLPRHYWQNLCCPTCATLPIDVSSTQKTDNIIRKTGAVQWTTPAVPHKGLPNNSVISTSKYCTIMACQPEYYS